MNKLLLVTLIFCIAAVCALTASRDYRLAGITHTLDESGTGNFQNITQYRFGYNHNNPAQVDTFSTYSWAPDINPPVGDWFRTEFRRISYNPTGEHAVLLEDFFQPGFPPYRQYTRQYDNQNRLLSSYCDVFFNEHWVNTMRYNYIYTEGYLTARDDYHYEFFSNTRLYLRNAYTLDPQGRICGETRLYSDDSLNWEPDSHTLITYHGNDQSTGEDYALYLAQIDMTSYLYDIPAYGMITEMVTQAMLDSVMTNAERTVCTYDDQNRLATSIRQHWADDWVNDELSIFSYNANNLLHNITRQNWIYDEVEWSPVIAVISLAWEEPTRNEDENVAPALQPGLSAYPNPFRSDLKITLKSSSKAPVKLYVCNILGQKIRNLNLNKDNSAGWDGTDKNGKEVSNGIYFLKAEQNGSTVCKKVIRIK
jgi:hypothetical protein